MPKIAPAEPAIRVTVIASQRLRAVRVGRRGLSQCLHMPGQCRHCLGDGMRARGGQFTRADDSPRRRRAPALPPRAPSSCHSWCRRSSPSSRASAPASAIAVSIIDGMRLGRVAIGGLQRDEARPRCRDARGYAPGRDRTCRWRRRTASRLRPAHRARRSCRRYSGSASIAPELRIGRTPPYSRSASAWCCASSASGSSIRIASTRLRPTIRRIAGALGRLAVRRSRTLPPSRGRYWPGCRPACRRSRTRRAGSSPRPHQIGERRVAGARKTVDRRRAMSSASCSG